jgi:hypothetical protein
MIWIEHESELSITEYSQGLSFVHPEADKMMLVHIPWFVKESLRMWHTLVVSSSSLPAVVVCK